MSNTYDLLQALSQTLYLITLFSLQKGQNEMTAGYSERPCACGHVQRQLSLSYRSQTWNSSANLVNSWNPQCQISLKYIRWFSSCFLRLMVQLLLALHNQAIAPSKHTFSTVV